MEKTIKKILKTWEASLKRYGKLDAWSYNRSLSILGDYLRSDQDSMRIRSIVRQVRDYAIYQTINVNNLLLLIKKALVADEPDLEEKKKSSKWCEHNRIQKNGQDVRFRNETERIFYEKLRFKEGMLLRNFDIETEPACDSRKVRRIVEKRMSQAYYRMMRSRTKLQNPSNRDRYWEKRATAFQLYNIGQIENIKGEYRTKSTHWKPMYDIYTKDFVFKKKMAYSTEEEALVAIVQWKNDHPFEYKEIRAYKCLTCNKWHIGHYNPITRNICTAS